MGQLKKLSGTLLVKNDGRHGIPITLTLHLSSNPDFNFLEAYRVSKFIQRDLTLNML